MLSIEELTLEIDNKVLCKNLSVSFLGGAIVNIYGENGCGKTSLLKVLAGLKEFDQGRVIYDVPNPLEEIRYLGHKNALKEYFTVVENLEFWAELSGNRMLIPAALSYFKLDDLAERKVCDLSAGQRRLVGLARLLVTPAKIWLLDEPFSNLDDYNLEKVKQLIIGKVNDGGLTVISSHKKVDFLDVVNLPLAEFN